MDRVKIYRNSKTDGFKELTVVSLIETTDELIIELAGNECYLINEGDIITFNRIIFGENENRIEFTDNVSVKYEDENHLIHTTLIGEKEFRLDFNDWHKFYYDDENSYDIVTFASKHGIYQQDLSACEGQELYFKDNDGNLLCTFSGISTFNRYTNVEMVIDDCIVGKESIQTCGKPYDKVTTYYYNFLPSCEDEYGLIVRDFSNELAQSAISVSKKFNEYYFYTVLLNDKNQPIEPDSHGNGIKHCVFYGDVWFDSLRNTADKKYINKGISHSGLYQNRTYFNVSLGMSSDSNETLLGSDEIFSKAYSDNLKNSLIPEFIDMERVKYIPCIKSGNNITHVTKITIYPHFRERVILDTENNTNTLMTSGNVYSDGWYIDSDNEADSYWNGYDWSNGLSSIGSFLSQCGKTSDLIGYLNFTDNDVYYRKDKVKKSFFRLSFYDSKDPVDQKLLYYSTVFIDGTELLSKYLKQLQYISDNEGDIDRYNDNAVIINDLANNNTKVVFCENNQFGCRVDSTITLSNEYDRSRSAEGFNLYLFSDDAPIGNAVRTIYMKVEFNHAGNGKTIPMVMWPKLDNGNYGELTIKNFIEKLYIPIEIFEKNGKFYYAFNGFGKGEINGTEIELVLLEPKLTTI